MIHADLVHAGKDHAVVVEKREGPTSARIGERSFEGEIAWLTPHCVSIRIGATRRTAFVARTEDRVLVHLGGQIFEFEEAGSKGKTFAGGPGALGDGSVSSPMPGRVVKIAVKEGQQVEKNQVLVIVEAMKMENPLKSSVRGTVRKIRCAEGDLVDAGKPIVEVDASED